MTLPSNILHQTPEEAARRITLAFLDEARAACDRLPDAGDVEALHDFRVAIRRMRSTVRAWREALQGSLGKKHARTLKALQQATGGGRDAEVALEWLATQRADLRPAHRRGHAWLVRRLEEQLGESMDDAAGSVRAAFDAVEAETRRRLEVMTVEVRLDGGEVESRFGDALARAARAHVEDLVRCLVRILEIEDEDEAHEARIRCKRLRYLVEPVAEHLPEARGLVKHCKRLQDVLGDLNDTRVLRKETGEAIQQAAADHARRLHELTRQDDPALMRREIRRSERSGLLEVTRRLLRRQRTLFDRLARGWLEDGAARLVADVAVFARQVEDIARSDEEIERKFLLTGRPDLPEDAPHTEIEQGYLPTRQVEERLRRITCEGEIRHVRTWKLGKGLRRLQVDEDVPPATFDALWGLTEGRRVRKRRHVVQDGDDVWEIDEFLDRDLWLAEIEFDDPRREVVPPGWLAPYVVADVTDKGNYGNRELAM